MVFTVHGVSAYVFSLSQYNNNLFDESIVQDSKSIDLAMISQKMHSLTIHSGPDANSGPRGHIANVPPPRHGRLAKCALNNVGNSVGTNGRMTGLCAEFLTI